MKNAPFGIFLGTIFAMSAGPFRLPLPDCKVPRKCALPDCSRLTIHNGGYCCREHCQQHRRQSSPLQAPRS